MRFPPAEATLRNGGTFASKCLPNTEKEIEMTSPLRNELSRGRLIVYAVGDSPETGKCRRIQIVVEINPDGTDGSLVMHPHAYRMRNEAKVTVRVGACVSAYAAIRL